MRLISRTALLPALWVFNQRGDHLAPHAGRTGWRDSDLRVTLIFDWYDSKTMLETDDQLGGRRVRAAAAAARPAARPAAPLNPLHLHLHRMQQQWI